MSIRDGVEPSRSQDSDTHTQPLPRDQAAPAQPAPDETAPGAAAPGEAAPGEAAPGQTGQIWPPSWGQAPTPTDRPGWTSPAAAQGPSWDQPSSPVATADPAQPGWGQGGGGHPTAPAWDARPADAGAPRDRRPSRWLAAALAGVVLLAGGYGLGQVLDRDAAEPAGAGIPTAAAPAASAGATSGEEPAAAVAKALLPTVVEISRDNGLGSGFIYDRNGYIMTAAHVVQGADEVDVRLYDGTKLTGTVVGTDQVNDIAVVRIDRTGLTAAPLAIGQKLQVGQLAIAIGSPFGLNETVTAGIISSTDRILDDGRTVIQTDAPINPGNSGGVLADRQGRVIGINDAIRPASDGSNGNVGIGFAVPIDLAAKSAESIVKGTPIQIGYLGVRMADPTGSQAGALVQEVTDGSPAEQAGLRAGDLITRIDGQAIDSYSELGARIRGHKPGDKITLTVVRGGNETTISATLTRRPAG